MLSKALFISNSTMAVSSFLSIALSMASVVWITDVSVKCHLLFPLWFFVSLSFERRYNVNWLWATLSQKFDGTGNNEMGLLLFACLWSPSLGIGVTSATFQTEGKVEVTKEVLTKDMIAGRIGARQSLIMRIGILSLPGALLDGIDVIISSICLPSLTRNENCSDNGYCLRVNQFSLSSKLHSLANDLTLFTLFWPTETKNLLNSSATVFSSLLKVLREADLLGRQRRMAFQMLLVLFGFFLYMVGNKFSLSDLYKFSLSNLWSAFETFSRWSKLQGWTYSSFRFQDRKIWAHSRLLSCWETDNAHSASVEVFSNLEESSKVWDLSCLRKKVWNSVKSCEVTVSCSLPRIEWKNSTLIK